LVKHSIRLAGQADHRREIEEPIRRAPDAANPIKKWRIERTSTRSNHLRREQSNIVLRLRIAVKYLRNAHPRTSLEDIPALAIQAHHARQIVIMQSILRTAHTEIATRIRRTHWTFHLSIPLIQQILYIVEVALLSLSTIHIVIILCARHVDYFRYRVISPAIPTTLIGKMIHIHVQILHLQLDLIILQAARLKN
jgi:hypothetical protein